MCAKLNELLAEQQTGIVLDFEWIEKNLTGGSIRERHLAKALRMKAYETFGEENQETLTAFFHETLRRQAAQIETVQRGGRRE